MDPDIRLHEITDLFDPYLLPWLDLYESAFPPHERAPVSWQIRILQQRQAEQTPYRWLWALLEPGGKFLGLAQASYNLDHRLVYLGYFAVEPGARGQGLGARFYNLLLPFWRQPAGVSPELLPDFMLFDVERPDSLPDPADQAVAQRRIAFYQRLGAEVLPGVTFYWGKSVQRLMAHRFVPLSDTELVERAGRLMREYGGALLPDPVPDH